MAGRVRWFWLAFVLLACSTISVERDYDNATNFSAVRTFKLETGRIVREGGEADRRDTLLDKRIKSALATQLESQGMRPSEEPDVLVYYTIGTTDVVSVQPAWGYGIGYGWGGWGRWRSPGYWSYPGWGYSNYWLTQFPVTNLVFEMVDAKSNDLIWRAEARADGNDRDAKRMNQIVEKAFEEYPPGSDN